MTLNTYGALRERLIANGYVPTSAIRPGAHGWKLNDDLAAVVCIPQHGGRCGIVGAEKFTVITLNVLARDATLRAAIASVLAKHGIAGPVRKDSAGSDAYVARWDNNYFPPPSEEIEVSAGVPAFAVGGWTRDSSPLAHSESAVIRCDGEWRGGDLLTVPRAKLPSVADEEALKTIVNAVREVIAKSSPRSPVHETPEGSPSWKPYEPNQLQKAGRLTVAERAVLQAGARGAIPHRERARLDRLAANGADAD